MNRVWGLAPVKMTKRRFHEMLTYHIFQNGEGFGGQGNLSVSQIGPARRSIDNQFFTGQSAQRMQGADARAGPPQHSPDPHRQLLGIEWLIEIIVCAFFERHDSFGSAADLGQQDNWYPVALPADRESRRGS